MTGDPFADAGLILVGILFVAAAVVWIHDKWNGGQP